MSQLMQTFAALRETKDYTGIIEIIPYAKFLGVQFEETAEGELRFCLPYAERNIGNVLMPALHGGVIGGFLENAAVLHLMWARETCSIPKIVDFSILNQRVSTHRLGYAFSAHGLSGNLGWALTPVRVGHCFAGQCEILAGLQAGDKLAPDAWAQQQAVAHE